MVRGISLVPGWAVRRLVPVAGRGARAVRPARAAEQLVVVLRRIGLDVGCRPRPVLPPHLHARTAGPELSQSRGAGRHAGHRPLLARPGRGWLPPGRVQRVLQGRCAALEPAPLAGGHPGLGPAAPRARQGPAGAPGLPDRFPGAARRHARAHERGRAVHRRAGGRGALHHGAPSHLRLHPVLHPMAAVGAGRHHRRAGGGVRSGPMAHGGAVEPRPAETCIAPGAAA